MTQALRSYLLAIVAVSLLTAILLGLPANMLKFITAALFLVILITGNMGRRKGGADRAGA